jgi:uncharacterized membrane protein
MTMMSIFNSLLFIHIVFGFTALSAAAGAISTKKGETIHRFCGKIFVSAMTGIVITAIPMSLIKHDLFLFLIALFSYYFAISGWLYATTRSGIASTLAWVIAIIMLCVGLAMINYSVFYLRENNYQFTVLTIFGTLSCINAISDLKAYYFKKAVGNYRIIKHLSAMLGATIATLTAFTVVNFHTNPEYLAWIGPTILITPLIVWWRIRVSNWISP